MKTVKRKSNENRRLLSDFTAENIRVNKILSFYAPVKAEIFSLKIT